MRKHLSFKRPVDLYKCDFAIGRVDNNVGDLCGTIARVDFVAVSDDGATQSNSYHKRPD